VNQAESLSGLKAAQRSPVEYLQAAADDVDATVGDQVEGAG
jgi:hypothetical protein